MIHLITSFFQSKLQHPNIGHRNREIVTCVRENLSRGFFEKLHLFVDDEASLEVLKANFGDTEKIVIIGDVSYNKQPTYKDMFDYAQNNLNGKLCMITNSDIYLHGCPQYVLDKLSNNTVYALTRHENNGTKPLIDDYHGSHDSFIFQSPLNVSTDEMNFYQNIWGSEARLLSILYRQNLTIKNPCIQLKIIHVHDSDVRNPNREWIGWHTPDNPEVNHPPVML